MYRTAVAHADRTRDDVLWQAIADALTHLRVGGDEKAEILAAILDSANVPSHMLNRIGADTDAIAADGATWDDTADLPSPHTLALLAKCLADPASDRGFAAEPLLVGAAPLDRTLGILLLTTPAPAYPAPLVARRLRPLAVDPDPHVARIAARKIARLAIGDTAALAEFIALADGYPRRALRYSVEVLTTDPQTQATALVEFSSHPDPHIHRLLIRATR